MAHKPAFAAAMALTLLAGCTTDADYVAAVRDRLSQPIEEVCCVPMTVGAMSWEECRAQIAAGRLCGFLRQHTIVSSTVSDCCANTGKTVEVHLNSPSGRGRCMFTAYKSGGGIRMEGGCAPE